MDNKSKFLEAMWRWTIIPLFAIFTITSIVVVASLIGYVMGDADALQSDAFKFCLLFTAFCIPFYFFHLLIKRIVTFAVSREE